MRKIWIYLAIFVLLCAGAFYGVGTYMAPTMKGRIARYTWKYSPASDELGEEEKKKFVTCHKEKFALNPFEAGSYLGWQLFGHGQSALGALLDVYGRTQRRVLTRRAKAARNRCFAQIGHKKFISDKMVLLPD